MNDIMQFIENADLVNLLIKGVTSLVFALIIFLIGRWIANMTQKAMSTLLRKRAVDEVLVNFLSNIVYVLILVAAVVAAIDRLGIPATSFMAIIGAAGLAIGLALKDSLANFASGVMLVLFRPFTKGDWVDAGGVSGTVQEVRLVSTTLTTGDNKLIIVPNALMYQSTITNYSANDTRRIDLVIGVGYDDDLKVAADVLAKVCHEHRGVLDEPPTKVFVTNLGDSSVDFVVRPWVKSDDYWTVRAEILEDAKVALEAAGCSIPYPQTDVHLHPQSAD